MVDWTAGNLADPMAVCWAVNSAVTLVQKWVEQKAAYSVARSAECLAALKAEKTAVSLVALWADQMAAL